MPFDPDKYLSKPKAFDPDSYLGSAPADKSSPRNAQAALEGFGETATAGYLPQIQAAVEPAQSALANLITGQKVETPDYLQRRDENLKRQEQLSKEAPVASTLGKLAGVGTSLLIPGSAEAGVGRMAAKGTALGALYNPGDTQGVEDPLQLGARAQNAAIGGALGGAMNGMAKSFAKGGDVAMQLAVGRNKYTPGVGETLANEGLIGTKGQMQDQVAAALERRGQQMQDIAKDIPAEAINPQDIADQINQRVGRSMRIPGADPAKVDQPKIATLQEFVDDVASRQGETGSQALARRQAAGARSYRGKEDPLQSLIGQASKQEQIGYSKALKEAGGPDMVDADQAYAALKKAESGLSGDSSVSPSILKSIMSGVKAIPGSSLGLSVGGRAAIGAGKAIPEVNPLLLKSLFEAKRKK